MIEFFPLPAVTVIRCNRDGKITSVKTRKRLLPVTQVETRIRYEQEAD